MAYIVPITWSIGTTGTLVELVFHVLLTRARTVERHFDISLTDRQHGLPYTCRWGHRALSASATFFADPHGARNSLIRIEAKHKALGSNR